MLKAGHHSLIGLILNRSNYRESDVIATILTREYGRLSGLAKYGRKSVKRFGGGLLSPGALGLYHLKAPPNRELVFLDRAEPAHDFDIILTEPKPQAWGALALEMTAGIETGSNPEAFDLLIWYLGGLKAGIPPRTLSIWFILKYLTLSGFAPFLEACVSCGRPLEPGYSWVISARAGGALCGGCAPSEDKGGWPIFLGSLKTLSLAQRWPLDNWGRLRMDQGVLESAEKFLWAWVCGQLGRELKSLKVISQLEDM